MIFLSNWQRNLGTKEFSVLIILFIFIFILYECILFIHLSAERSFNKAAAYLQRARSLGKDIVVEKSLLYYKGLRLLKDSLRLNPRDSRFYFEYAEILAEIGADPQLSEALDIDRLDENKTNALSGFYDLAKRSYIQAILREPTNAVYHQRLGKMYDRLSYAAKAEKEFQKATLLAPHNLSVHLYLSQYFLSKNKEEEFLLHINKAIELQRVVSGGIVAGDVIWFLRSIGREDLAGE